MPNYSQLRRDEQDAATAYILSQRQGLDFIAVLMGRPIDEVKILIADETQRRREAKVATKKAARTPRRGGAK